MTIIIPVLIIVVSIAVLVMCALIRSGQISEGERREEYAPRTELGRKLMEHRNKAIANGMKLLSEDEIGERRRGIE